MKTTFEKPLWCTVKTTLCFIAVTLFATTGCEKVGELNGVETHVVTKIEAKVENASKYCNIVSVKLMVFALNIGDYIELASGDWKGDGFTMALPETVEQNYLQASEYNRGLLEPIANSSLAMTISNRDVKAGTAHFYGVDKDGNFVTSFYPLKINESGAADEAFFSYVNSNVTISGHYETEAVQDFEVNGIMYIALVKTSTTYSVDLKKGWNVWWLSNIRCEQDFTITNKWSTAPVDKQKWYSFEDKWELLQK